MFIFALHSKKKKSVFLHQQHRQQLLHIDSFGLYEFPHHMAVTQTHTYKKVDRERESQRASLPVKKENHRVKNIKSSTADSQMGGRMPPPHRFKRSGLSSPSRLYDTQLRLSW